MIGRRTGGTSWAESVRVNTIGNVGIGTNTPAAPLHVYGAGASSSYSSYQFSIGNSSSNRNIIFGTDGTSGSIQSTVDLSTTPASAWLTLNPLGGNVGIGTNAPAYPLHITRLVTTGETVGAFLGSGGVGGSATGMGTSLLIDGWGITRGAWGAISDKRIKKNIEPVTNIMSIIKQIEVVHYDYINRNEGRDECSVIAQQLQQIFPNAISTQTDIIPNIIKYATHTKTNEMITILVAIDNTVDTQKDIVVGSTLKCYVTGNDDSEREEQSVIHSIDIPNGIIVIPAWNNYVPEDKLFVYGTKVHDFLVVDKPQLGIMALQGVKEQQDIIDQQSTQLASQSTQLASQSTQLASQSTQLTTLQTQLATLQTQVATLIERLG